MPRMHQLITLRQLTLEEILEKMEKLPDAPVDVTAKSLFGTRDFTNFFPCNAAVEDTTRQLIKHYNLLDIVGALPGENSWFVKFQEGPWDPNLANTLCEGIPGEANFCLEGVELTLQFLDPTKANCRFLIRVLLHEIVHVICTRIPLSSEQQILHSEEFQRVRIQLERITGVDLCPH
ncbi:hypothetical protein Ddc_12400 [Ditylenchus destructor]|nr:hypothetical protein Ddc_12400 [Ditylenchus destructor]